MMNNSSEVLDCASPLALFIAVLTFFVSLNPACAADSQTNANRIVQDPSGLITLAASNAVTHGTQLRYEPATNKNCLGYWTKVEDWAEWQFEVTKPGLFEIEIWQGCGQGQGGSEVAVEVGDQRFSFIVEDTGHFQNFVPRRVGSVRFTTAGRQTLALKPQRKQANAIMDIRQVVLRPVIAKPKLPLHKQAAADEGSRIPKADTKSP